MIPPRFAVVGTGRCGTGYVAAVLCHSGLRCGHEQWWTPAVGRRVGGLDGDSSWLAVPDIEADTWSGPVLHVTRHPVDVVSSLIGIGFFYGPPREYLGFALDHEPELADLLPLRASVEWWARWNARCAAVADLTIPVEDLAGRLDDIGDLIGGRLDEDQVIRVPTTVNRRQRVEVDPAAVWELLDGRAERFGYHP